jgi:hypothetical protein
MEDIRSNIQLFQYVCSCGYKHDGKYQEIGLTNAHEFVAIYRCRGCREVVRFFAPLNELWRIAPPPAPPGSEQPERTIEIRALSEEHCFCEPAHKPQPITDDAKFLKQLGVRYSDPE